MNIFTTVMSGAPEQLFPLLDKTQQLLIMTDKNIVGLDCIRSFLHGIEKQGIHYTLVDDLPAEPTDTDVYQLIEHLPAQADLVLGIGGGSVLDISKLIAVLYHPDAGADKRTRFDRLLNADNPQHRIPLILVPTTAGTGAEATPNAIIALPDKLTKVGIISPVMLPDYVLLAPAFTTSMPAPIAASTGIDALCHLIECFTACIANPVGDNYAMIGMQKFFMNIEHLIDTPEDLTIRMNLLWASYYGGAAISHSGTHLVHALSYPLGGTYKIPHGLANALLLVPVMKHICAGCTEKLAQVYQLLPSAKPDLPVTEQAQALIDYLEQLVARLKLPTRLNAVGISQEQLPGLAAGAMEVKRLLNHSPVSVTEAEILSIYQSITD
ncbi:iron-containing alcohol dehydrogenase [Vibrio quintilis]|uniref:1,3-propanediol dehydrogenase n=1 Tax=Vibrio quintilis TaxID=1117707 RepID=A0A1M7YUI7_9VIBR|nr:iron-containing alcohol dehydrogenase [Vibrio quintilis]SHO56238.1 1,3-propanediol dehydrogenase [Vibrio quintilis]